MPLKMASGSIFEKKIVGRRKAEPGGRLTAWPDSTIFRKFQPWPPEADYL